MLQRQPWIAPYLDGYMVLCETGRMPHELGLKLDRRRFNRAAVIFARHIGVAKIMKTCPLLGGGGTNA